MKVHELIAALQKLPQNHDVITDLHSEFALLRGVFVMAGYESGDYISAPYGDHGRLRAHDYVYIGIREDLK